MPLVAERLQRAFGPRRVVDDVTVSLERGEVVGVLGRNGAGKSTTFQMIAGYIAPNAGQILLDGADVSRKPPYERARLGLTYLPQERSVFLKLTARENILLPLEERGVSKRERLARAESYDFPVPLMLARRRIVSALLSALRCGSRDPGPVAATRRNSSPRSSIQTRKR